MAPTPDDPVEREARTLARKLQAARGFCFVVYFVEDQRASQGLRVRLEALLASRGDKLVALTAGEPPDLADTTLRGIFEAAVRVAGTRPVVWAEAFRDNGDAAWDAQRRLLLMRMNERRSRFESELAAPLILLLPAGGQRDAASLAPDLWHVRLHSAQLSVAPSTGAEVDGPTPDKLSGAVPTPLPAALPDAPPKAVAYWNAVHAAARGAARVDPQALDSLSLHDGFDAVHGWLRTGRADRAVHLAGQLAGLARDRLAAAGGDTSIARRDLAIALRTLGDSLAQAGTLDQALSTLSDGVDLARSADASTGRDPAATQVLSTLLSSLGDTLLRAGRAGEAEGRFRESLALVRLLPGPADPSESSVVVTLLGRVGDAALAARHSRAALQAYRESVVLWQHLRESGGDDPALLRSLADALMRLGDAEWDDGQGERAMTAYAESLALLQENVSRVGATDETQLDLALMLLRIGRAEQAVGRLGAALSAYDKVLTLGRRLSPGDSRTASLLADLASRLKRLVEAGRGEVPPSPATLDLAARLLAEALTARAAAPE